MRGFFRSFSKKLLIGSNCIAALLLALSLLHHWIAPVHTWWIAILGLGFPLLFLANLLFVAGWLLFRSRWAWLSVVVVLLSLPDLFTVVAFRGTTAAVPKTDSQQLRIMSWNIFWFDEQARWKRQRENYSKAIMEYIAEKNPDIICFQEYLEAEMPGKKQFRSGAFAEMGYPYHHFAIDYKLRRGMVSAGVMIFSKYPILQTFQWKYKSPRSGRGESLIAADIQVRDTVIRVFTTHLQSVHLEKEDYHSLEIIKTADDSLMDASKSILRKLKRGYQLRSEQAELVRKVLDSSQTAEILCGDFNDVPTSYTYATIKGKRQDAFLEKGGGLGRTYSRIFPTLRIDYVLLNKAFRVQQFQIDRVPYSDHYPVVVDFSLPAPGK